MPPPPSSRSSSSPKAKSSGPGGGSLSAPSRTAPSSAKSGGNSGYRPSGPPTRGISPARSGPQADKRNIQSSAVRDAEKIARESYALRQDAQRSGVRSINVGPMQQPVTIGAGRVPKSATSPDYESFYASDPSYQGALQKMRADRERARSAVSQSDAVKYGRESPAYDFITDAERARLSPSGIAGRIVGGISDLASYAYNNPIQAAGNVVGALAAPFVTGGQYLMGAKPMFDRQGNILPQAADDLTGVAMGTAIGANVAGFAAPRPVNSLGALVGRSTKNPELQKMFDSYDAARLKGATEVDAFYESMRGGPSFAGGVHGIVSEVPKDVNLPVRSANVIEVNERFPLRPTGLASDISGSLLGVGKIERPVSYSQVFDTRDSPLVRAYPQTRNTIVYSSPRPNPGRWGAYYAPGMDNPNLGTAKYLGKTYGSTELNVPQRPGFLGGVLNPKRPTIQQLANHEIGVHGSAARDFAGNIQDPIPWGSNFNYEKSVLLNEISNSQAPPMSQRDIDRIAYNRYAYSPGEVAARRAQDTSRGIAEMQNWDTRFGAYSKEDMENMSRYSR